MESLCELHVQPAVSVDLSILRKYSIDSEHTFSFTLKFDTRDRFARMTHRWKAKDLLFPTLCYNIWLSRSGCC